MMEVPILLTPNDMMKILGVGKSTMNKILQSGETPAFKLGGSWRCEKDEFIKWIISSRGKRIYIS